MTTESFGRVPTVIRQIRFVGAAVLGRHQGGGIGRLSRGHRLFRLLLGRLITMR